MATAVQARATKPPRAEWRRESEVADVFVIRHVKGSWGPAAADDVLDGFGRWHQPWVAS